MGGLAPMPYTPTTAPKPIVAGQVCAGDWVQVMLSIRQGSTPVAFTSGFFLVHVLYSPNADDATAHPDQPATYGGSPSGTNRRSVYRIDPGVAFQVPWDGQLSIVAGGDSPPTTVLDVVVRKGFAPRAARLQEHLAELAPMYLDPFGALAGIAPMVEMMGGPVLPRGDRVWAPPVVGSPRLVPATWIAVPVNTPIAFPDGAAQMVAVDETGTPANPIPFVVTTLGATLRLNCASGLPRDVAHLAQGGACSDGTAATWTSTSGPLGSVTILSSLGC